MKFTVKVRGTVDHGEWKREDFMAGRAGEGIAASIRGEEDRTLRAVLVGMLRDMERRLIPLSWLQFNEVAA
jgi:hypothetical protein